MNDYDESQSKILDFLKVVSDNIIKELGGHVSFVETTSSPNYKIKWNGIWKRNGGEIEIYFEQKLSYEEIETYFALNVANHFIEAVKKWEETNNGRDYF